VRAELEGLAAERAAGRLTTYDLADLQTAQSLLRAGYQRHAKLEASDTRSRQIVCEQWSHANELFHNVVLAAANCPPLRDTVHSLANRVPRSLAWQTFGDDPGIIPRSIEDHERIADALVKPDGKRARRILRAHVMDTGETLARWLERHVR